MMGIDRVINLEQLSDEMIAKTAEILGENIRNDVDQLCDKYKKKLKRYGLTCKFSFHILENDET